MDLLLTVDGRDDDVAHDLVLTVDDTTTTATVAAELARVAHADDHLAHDSVTLTCARLGGRLPPEQPFLASGIRSGDRVVVEPGSSRMVTRLKRRRDHYALVVLAGPRSGMSFPLRDGVHELGRDTGSDIVLGDDAVSRRHAVLTVSEDVRVADAGSTNGTFVAGRRIGDAVVLEPGVPLAIGDSVVTLTRVDVHDRGDSPSPPTANGSVAFNRPPRVEPAFVAREVRVPAPPDDPPRNRLPFSAALVPLVIAGLVFAFTSGSERILVLVFLLMSPLMVVGSYVEARRSGRLDRHRLVERHRAKVERIVEDLASSATDEAASRRRAHPDVAAAYRRVDEYLPSLWERRPTDDDFLALRVGTADLPSQTRITVEDGGSDDLRSTVDELPARFASIPDVPACVPLRDAGGVGIAGERDLAVGLASWFVLQTVTLHSPVDVEVVALLGTRHSREWAWLKWLPHTRTAPSAFDGPHVAVDPAQATEVLDLLYATLDQRRAALEGHEATTAVTGPWLLVLVDEDVALAPAALTDLLVHGPSVGIVFVFVASARRDIPGACGAVVEVAHARDGTVAAVVGFTDDGRHVDDVVVDAVGAPVRDTWARRLAPLLDVSRRAPRELDLPAAITLADVLGDVVRDPDAVVRRWSESSSLRAPIGMTAGGVFSIDLRADGPHALVAGTTGSGKSELLQTLVAALAASRPPDRLSFLLVDYKGGAAFDECVGLPHAAGLVTDLTEHLVRRALVSLNAELQQRERVLARAGAKDLRDLERSRIADAPPNLVIVIDEFAALAKEVPEFVDGVVDVAQRGRSLGLHLVLATQRPAGVVTDTIRANTNLRVALRVADDDESNDVVGVPSAATIDRATPGRAIARVGHREIVPFQSAYGGGPAEPDGERAGSRGRATARPLVLGGAVQPPDAPAPAVAMPAAATSELQRLVGTVVRAAERARVTLPPRPWLDPLPAVLRFSSLVAARSDHEVVLGVLDEPARQRQLPAVVDLEQDGSLLVVGTGASGKSTLLRTFTVSATRGRLPDEVSVYALDCGGRALARLVHLPHVGAVIDVDDDERVTRLFRMVHDTIRRRGDAMADHGLATFGEYRATLDEAAREPRIFVLIDDYSSFTSTYDTVDGGRLVDQLPRLVSDGRNAGVHFVLTGDRRSSFSPALMAVIRRRLLLRLASVDEYVALGMRARDVELDGPPGRAVLDGLDIQVARLGSEEADDQASVLVELGRREQERCGGIRAEPVDALPDAVARDALPAPEIPLVAFVGIDDDRLEPACLDLSFANALIAGPNRSGRSTALRTIAASLTRARADTPSLHLLAARRGALADASWWSSVAVGRSACETAAAELAERVEHSGPEQPVVVFVDDATDLVDSAADGHLAQLLRASRELAVRVVASGETHAVRHAYGFLGDLRHDKTGLLLQPDEMDGDVFAVRLPRRSRPRFPAGRAYLVQRNEVALVQIAT